MRQFQPPDKPTTFEDRFIFDLFLYGDVRSEFVWQSLHSHVSYFVDSTAASDALASLERGYRAVVFYADLGNGKTAVLEELKVKAFDVGYDVYDVVINSESLIEELQAIFRSTHKVLLVVEHYPDWLPTIDFISKNAPPSCVFAFTTRTSLHDLMVDRLADRLRPGTLLDVPIDSCGFKNASQLSISSTVMGFGRTLAAKSRAYKIKHVRQVCNSEWHAILIDRFRAPQIQQRFAPIIETLTKTKKFFEVVIAVLVLNVLWNMSPRSMC